MKSICRRMYTQESKEALSNVFLPQGGTVTIQPSLIPYERPQLRSPSAGKEKDGVVYTKPWVVDLILDLVGYTSDRPLHEKLLVEPSAGDGSFLVRAAARLAEACKRSGTHLAACAGSIVAFELDEKSTERARFVLAEALVAQGVRAPDAELLADCWVRTGDYLMESSHLNATADFVVGNPPYIRLEDLGEIGDMYRSAYPTMVGRADVYVAFFEAALRHLKAEGVCGFICADRWMFNQYGAELRAFVTSRFSVEAVIQMHHANAFEQDVSAYPAVTIIRNAKQGAVSVASLKTDIEFNGGSDLAEKLAKVYDREASEIGFAKIDQWFSGNAPWPLMEPRRIALLRRLEAEYSQLEETGAVVGIGVATGADKIFITKDAALVESDRLLPLAMAFDVKHAAVTWSGHYLVNPWDSHGLIDLGQYPKMAAYLEEHRSQLQGRHIGKKVPANWFRTIDRINSQLATKSKLYLPDFKGRIAPVIDRGETYPHHNLYFIAADDWDLEVLGGLLLSDVAQFFIEAYGVRMRGGYLRFQAQYLRRICVPKEEDISEAQKSRLKQAFATHDVEESNAVASELYKLTSEERKIIGPSETIS